MIEITVLKYLDSVLPVDVYMERPEDAPESYVLVEKTGSQRTDYVYTTTFAFQSYAPTLLEAAQLNEKVKAAIFDITVTDSISAAKIQSDYNFTNPATKQPRYQAVFELTHF